MVLITLILISNFFPPPITRWKGEGTVIVTAISRSLHLFLSLFLYNVIFPPISYFLFFFSIFCLSFIELISKHFWRRYIHTVVRSTYKIRLFSAILGTWHFIAISCVVSCFHQNVRFEIILCPLPRLFQAFDSVVNILEATNGRPCTKERLHNLSRRRDQKLLFCEFLNPWRLPPCFFSSPKTEFRIFFSNVCGELAEAFI